MKKVCLRSAILFCMVLVMSLSAGSCASKQNAKLRVCFDIGSQSDMDMGSSLQQMYVEAFQSIIERAGFSPDDIELEVIPSDESQATERSATLQRIRTEIMTGGGPDVFVCVCDPIRKFNVADDRLFPYPEKAMESGFFLPLDQYVDDLERSAWDELERGVMDGGKNSQGEQVILPITYTIPLLSFYQEDLAAYDSTGASWDHVLSGSDPILAEQVRWFWDLWDGLDVPRKDFHEPGFAYIYPDFIDADTGLLGFTEEELLTRVKQSLSAYRRLYQQEANAESSNSICYYDVRWDGIFMMSSKELTIVPLRNENGGTTAVITQYCAVNRNTKRVKEAVSAVDVLLSEGMWFNSDVVTIYNIPVNRNVLIKRNTNVNYGDGIIDMGLKSGSFQGFLKAADQVNAVRYPCRMDFVISDMVLEIQEHMALRNEDSDPQADPIYSLRANFIEGSISEEELAEIVHKYYMKLCRMVDES